MPGVVSALFISAKKKAAPASVDEVRTNNRGFEGDYHSRSANRRQILMICEETLNQLDLTPGTIFENVVVRGLDVMSLREGGRLRMGTAILEVTIPCEPCVMMDRIRPGLRKALDGRRGMFATVVAPGAIRVGDSVEALS